MGTDIEAAANAAVRRTGRPADAPPCRSRCRSQLAAHLPLVIGLALVTRAEVKQSLAPPLARPNPPRMPRHERHRDQRPISAGHDWSQDCVPDQRVLMLNALSLLRRVLVAARLSGRVVGSSVGPWPSRWRPPSVSLRRE